MVLLVDDDQELREVMADSLQERGYAVIAVANGLDALKYLQISAAPAIIILDLMMPIMDGYEFLAHQARDPALLNIPVLILTGTPPPGTLATKAVLTKPVHPKELFKMIERFRHGKN